MELVVGRKYKLHQPPGDARYYFNREMEGAIVTLTTANGFPAFHCPDDTTSQAIINEVEPIRKCWVLTAEDMKKILQLIICKENKLGSFPERGEKNE